jgi:hypothetical protein
MARPRIERGTGATASWVSLYEVGARSWIARRPAQLVAGAALVSVSALGAAAEDRCFDVRRGIRAPLKPPIALLGDGDNSRYGTYRDGTDWASARAVVRMPIGRVLAKLRDHRNLKDMRKTRLVVHHFQEPSYLDLRHVEVEVVVRALLLKRTIRWTEEWAYRLVEGTQESPALVLANYQKIAGTSHIQHQCGSYSVRPFGPDATDLALYEEVRATRRSAEDTRNMHRGILRNLREDRWQAAEDRADPRVRHLEAAAR